MSSKSSGFALIEVVIAMAIVSISFIGVLGMMCSGLVLFHRGMNLIKSQDRGLTWTRIAKENYDTPMWLGARFGAPSFIHFGKNGGQITYDNAGKFVYAVSNNGFWNGGDALSAAPTQSPYYKYTLQYPVSANEN